ncbi:MAG: hypothetical protein Q9163_000810 [Psora crenata]
MGSKTQQRHHGGHSHTHHHDNTYLTSANKKDAGVRITRVGLYVNFMMAVGKATGGYFLNSQSLMADAFHSLTDLVSDFLTLGTVAWSLKAPTQRFPSGYGKIESLGSLGVSGLLLAGGLGLGWHSLEILYNMWFVDPAAMAAEHMHHGHDHGHGHGGGGIFGHSHSHNPADMAIKIARERKSSVLASNAVHHRIDSLTSIVALTAILGSNLFSNIAWLDPVGGLLVSLTVVRAGWGNIGNALLELADVGIASEIKDSVRRAANTAVTDETFAAGSVSGKDIEVREVQGIKAGQSYLVEIELGVPEDLSVKDMRPIEDMVRKRVGAKVRGIRRVKVKFVPTTDEAPDFVDEFIAADVSPRSSPEPEDSHDHQHEHEHGNKHRHTRGDSNGDVMKKR